MFGVGVGAMALIIVLSAFNGINNLVEGLYSSFDSEIRIEAVNAKTFDDSDVLKTKILDIDGVKSLNRSLEETVFIKYKESQTFAVIKGVDSTFITQSGLDSLMWAGEADLTAPNGNPKLIVGYMVAEQLGLFIQNALQPIYVYAAKNSKNKSLSMENAFYIEPISPSGVFAVNQDIDTKYTVAPIEYVSNLLQKEGVVTAYELALNDPNKLDLIKEQLIQILGPEFSVKTRYQQNELLYKTNNTEKWATFLILTFILLIATFNVIGSLTILILDKKRDIFVLRGMGATQETIKRIFFTEGLLISITGGFVGLGLGIILVVLQSQFGFIPVQGLLIDHYPVELHFVDVISIMGIVVVIGSLAAMLPAKVVLRRFA
jgi:ABC-type lipoprotein release transport system permease subunit